MDENRSMDAITRALAELVRTELAELVRVEVGRTIDDHLPSIMQDLKEMRSAKVAVTYLPPADAAADLGFSSKTLANWRLLGSGPSFSKVGRVVRYQVEDLEAWIAVHGQRTPRERTGTKSRIDNRVASTGQVRP